MIRDQNNRREVNKKMLLDDDLVVIGKPRDALDTIEKNEKLIDNLEENHENPQVENDMNENDSDAKPAPRPESMAALLQKVKRMYKPARAIQYSKFFVEKKIILGTFIQEIYFFTEFFHFQKKSFVCLTFQNSLFREQNDKEYECLSESFAQGARV